MAPGAVSAVKLRHSTSDSLLISWPPAAANGNPVTHYNIERTQGKNGEPVAVETEGAVNSYTITNLVPDSSYHVRVQVKNMML